MRCRHAAAVCWWCAQAATATVACRLPHCKPAAMSAFGSSLGGRGGAAGAGWRGSAVGLPALGGPAHFGRPFRNARAHRPPSTAISNAFRSKHDARRTGTPKPARPTSPTMLSSSRSEAPPRRAGTRSWRATARRRPAATPCSCSWFANATAAGKSSPRRSSRLVSPAGQQALDDLAAQEGAVASRTRRRLCPGIGASARLGHP